MLRSEEWIGSDGAPLDGAPLGMLLSAQSDARPNSAAFTIGGRTYPFGEFDRLANRRARHLLEWGIRAGDRVILTMPNRLEYLECVFALWKIGAVPCPVSHRLPTAELSEIIRLSEARLIIGQAGLQDELIAIWDINRPLPAHFSDEPLSSAVSTPGKIANSGGSTGRPKLIMDPNPSVWGPDKMGCRRGPRLTLLNPGPLYHSAPFNTTTMAMAQGSHIICLDRFDPHEWLAAVENYKVGLCLPRPDHGGADR